MKKLNNKGMTTIEILLTFVIVISIVISMYASISSLKEKQTIESYKQSIISYKDLLTRQIQNDLIINQLINVNISTSGNINDADGKTTNIDFTFRNNSKKTLKIYTRNGCEAIDQAEVDVLCSNKGISKNQEAKYSIVYDNEEFSLPNLGSEKIANFGESGQHTIYSLKIDDVIVNTDNDIFSLKIKLLHPNLGDKYSINITSPINY